MKNKKAFWILGVMFIIVLGIRLYFAFQQQYFSSPDAYFTLKQIEAIKDTGIPIFQDHLSYGGRYLLFLPLFHYIMAFFSMLLPFIPTITLCKILPNIFASATIIPIFYFVKDMTKKEDVALFGAFISTMIPVFVAETLNSISVYSLTIPLSIVVMHLFFRINKKKDPVWFIVLFVLFLLMDGSAIFLVLAIILYLIFSWTEGLQIKRAEIELIIFSVFITVFFYMIFFREALIIHGPSVIYKNIPISMLQDYFSQLNIVEAIINIGIIPLASAIFLISIYFSKKKKKSVYLPMSFTIVVAGMLFMKLIPLTLGLIYLGVMCAILFGEFYSYTMDYFKKTKFISWRLLFHTIFIINFIITAFIPSVNISQETMIDSTPKDLIDASYKLSLMAEDSDVIINTPKEGHIITYFSGKKTIMDTNYMFISNIDQRFNDIKTIYTSALSFKALELMEKYNARYIVFGEEAMHLYNITKISYANEECFPLVFSKGDTKVYEKKCELKHGK